MVCGAGQLVEISKRPEEISMLLTDMLFRTGGRANLLQVPDTYRLKPSAAELLRARILRATACFHIVRALSLSCACVQDTHFWAHFWLMHFRFDNAKNSKSDVSC